jgi:hypothetical protein
MIDGNPISVDRLAPDMLEILKALQEQRPRDWRTIVRDYNLGKPGNAQYIVEGFSLSHSTSALRRIRNHITANPEELPIIGLYACEHCGEADYRIGTHGPGYCSL